MTDETIEEDFFEAELGLTLRASDEGEIALRQVALGAGPLILIVPDYDPSRRLYSFSVDATDCGDPEALASTLEALAALLRGVAEAEEAGELEEPSGDGATSDR